MFFLCAFDSKKNLLTCVRYLLRIGKCRYGLDLWLTLYLLLYMFKEYIHFILGVLSVCPCPESYNFHVLSLKNTLVQNVDELHYLKSSKRKKRYPFFSILF